MAPMKNQKIRQYLQKLPLFTSKLMFMVLEFSARCMQDLCCIIIEGDLKFEMPLVLQI